MYYQLQSYCYKAPSLCIRRVQGANFRIIKAINRVKNLISNPFKILVKVPTFLVVNHTFMRHATSIGNLGRIEINVQLLA